MRAILIISLIISFFPVSILAEEDENLIRDWSFRAGQHISSYTLLNVGEKYQAYYISEDAASTPPIPRPDGTLLYARFPHFPVWQANRIKFTHGGSIFGFNTPEYFRIRDGIEFVIFPSATASMHQSSPEVFYNRGDGGFGIYNNGYKFEYLFRIKATYSIAGQIGFGFRFNGFEIIYSPTLENSFFESELWGLHYPYSDEINPNTGSRDPAAIPRPYYQKNNFNVLLTTNSLKINLYLLKNNSSHITFELRGGVQNRSRSRLGFQSHQHMSLSYSQSLTGIYGFVFGNRSKKSKAQNKNANDSNSPNSTGSELDKLGKEMEN